MVTRRPNRFVRSCRPNRRSSRRKADRVAPDDRTQIGDEVERSHAYCAYLAIQDGARYSAAARGFLRRAAETWHRKEERLRQFLCGIADFGGLAALCTVPAFASERK